MSMKKKLLLDEEIKEHKNLWNTPGATQRACEILKELTKNCEKTPLENHHFVFSKKEISTQTQIQI